MLQLPKKIVYYEANLKTCILSDLAIPLIDVWFKDFVVMSIWIMYREVHSSNMETTQMIINNRMKKQMMKHLHNGLLKRARKITTMYNKMN